MVEKINSTLAVERTESLPAQEKVAYGAELAQVLSAEQAFMQSFAVVPQNGGFQIQGLIP